MDAERLFGPGGADRAREYMRRFAASFGIDDMRQPDHIPSTRPALAVAEYARDRDRLHPFRTAAMDAYWRDGRDIEDPDVIRELAATTGLDPEAAVAAMTDRAYLDRIEETRRQSHEAGVSGIPTFFIGDQKVVGCQPYEALARAAEAAGAVRRSS